MKRAVLFFVMSLAFSLSSAHAEDKKPVAADSLITAIYLNDEAAVRKHLSNPEVVKLELDPTCAQYTRCKPITYAAENGNLEILKMLLDAGADPDGATSYGDTPLIIALMANKSEVVDLLLEYKADVNAINKFGVSAFIGVCMLGDIAMLEKFIKHGAEINKVFPFRNPKTKNVQINTTPLSAAVQLENLEVAKILLKNNADIQIKDDMGKNVIDYALKSDNQEIKKLFLQTKTIKD